MAHPPNVTFGAAAASPRFRDTFDRKRLLPLILLSASSGLPLGFIFTFLPVFLRDHGVDLKTIGVLSVVSLPWSLKVFWSPLMDRFAFGWPGRRRSWALLTQVALAGLMFVGVFYTLHHQVRLADGKLSLDPGAALGFGLLGLLIAFASATQDIALDAYAVELTHKSEAGAVSGLRNLLYRLGMLVAQLGVAISGALGWARAFFGMGLCFLFFMGLTFTAAEPAKVLPPRSLVAAVVEPLVSFFRRPGILSIALFIFFYKLGDNFVGTLVNPFLADTFTSRAELGLAVKTVGLAGALVGAAVGALVMTRIGIGKSLWIFGFLQAGGNALYAVAAMVHPVAVHITALTHPSPLGVSGRVAAYGAIFAEYAFQGMASAALSALFLQLCEKRFGATQYALLTSVMAGGRTLAGLPSGVVAEKVGYPTFFMLGVLLSIPGLLFLQRIAPLHKPDLPLGVEDTPAPVPP